MSRSRTWTALLASAFAIACGESLYDGPRAVEFIPSERERYGSVDGELTLTNPVDVWVGEDRVLILEASPPRVLELGLDGSVRSIIGGQGDGPGEFAYPREVGVMNGLVWVADPNGGRLEFFGADGSSTRSTRFQVPADEEGAGAVPRAPLADGGFIAGPPGTSIGGVLAGTQSHDTFYRTAPSGLVLNVVYERPLPSTDFFLTDGQRGVMGGHPLMERPLVSFFPDGSGLVIIERWPPEDALAATYRMLIWDELGNRELDVELPYAPVHTGNWKRLERWRLEQDVPEEVRSMFDPVIEAWSEREFYPPVTDLRAGQDGRILIRRESSEARAVRWQILSRAGEVEGSLWLPATTQLLTVTSQHVWGVEKDDLDVPYVVRYTLKRRSD